MSPRVSRTRLAPYAQAVPAAERTMAVLEEVVRSADGLTLTELSPRVGVSQSSLLALLRTLTRLGYVEHDSATRRFRPAPPLATLGQLAANALLPIEQFHRLAGPIAQRLDGTISLWTLEEAQTLLVPAQEAQSVLVAAEEAPSQLRFAPRPGLCWPAGSSAVGLVLLAASPAQGRHRLAPRLNETLAQVRNNGYADGLAPLEPDLYVVAVPVSAGWRGAPLAVAYAAPNPARVRAGRSAVVEALVGAARTLASAADRAFPSVAPARRDLSPVWLPNAAGPIAPAELNAFLDGPWLANLACVKENGYPYTVPIWYEWDGAAFWVVPRKHAEWAAHVRRNPQVSLTIGEQEPPLRRVLVEGRAEIVEDGGARPKEIERRMAERYLGAQSSAYAQAVERLPRGLFRIVPEKMLSWRGLAPHPRYYQQDPSPGEQAGAGRLPA